MPPYVPVKVGTDLVSAYLVETNNDGPFDLIVFDARSSKVTTLASNPRCSNRWHVLAPESRPGRNGAVVQPGRRSSARART